MGLGDDAYTVTVSYSKEVKLDETNEDSSATSVKTTGSYSLRVGGKVLSDDGSDTTSSAICSTGTTELFIRRIPRCLDASYSAAQRPQKRRLLQNKKCLQKCGSCGKARIQQNMTKHRGGSR